MRAPQSSFPCQALMVIHLIILTLMLPLAAQENAVAAKLLSIVEAKKMLDFERSSGKEPIVVDVRAEAEFRRSHIPGALNISAREEATVVKNIESRNISKDTAILFYSGSGTRSKRVTEEMLRAGFSKAYGLDKGLRAWELEGFPIEREK